MEPQDFPDFSAEEQARNELWFHPLAAALMAVVGRTVRLGIASRSAVEWQIVEVAPEWFRASVRSGVEVVAQTVLLDWLGIDVRSPGPAPDAVAPRFRGVLAELGRRRERVRVVCVDFEASGRIHHVGADYLELTRDDGAPVLLSCSRIGWVEFGPEL